MTPLQSIQALIDAQRFGEATTAATALERQARAAGDRQTAAAAVWLLGHAAMGRGVADDAETAYQRALDDLEQLGDPANAAVVRQTLAVLRSQTDPQPEAERPPADQAVQAARGGDFDAALAIVDAALDADPPDAEIHPLLVIRAQIQAVRKQFDAARADLDRVEPIIGRLGADPAPLIALRQSIEQDAASYALLQIPLAEVLSADAPPAERLIQLGLRLNAHLAAADADGAAEVLAAASPLATSVDDPGAQMTFTVAAIQARAALGQPSHAAALLDAARALLPAVPQAKPALDALTEMLATARG